MAGDLVSAARSSSGTLPSAASVASATNVLVVWDTATPAVLLLDTGHPAGLRMVERGGFGDPASPKRALLIECGQHWEASAAEVARGRRVADGVRTLVVPGSHAVKAQAEAEGLDEVFRTAGFDWREPGCSMCLAMNDDRLKPHERCASTSNRNFEGRQGFKGRTHLVSPAMAAAAAIAGHFVDVRDWH